MNRIIFILLLFLLKTTLSSAQFKLADLGVFPLGQTFAQNSSKESILNYFSGKSIDYSIWKGDFLNCYQITLENAPFDYYGEADYSFNYVKDTLTDIEIEFNFPAARLSDFERLVTQLNSDLRANSQNEYLAKTATLNIAQCIEVAKQDCIEFDGKNDRAITPKSLGQGVWIMKNTTDQKRIALEVTLTTGSRTLKKSSFDSEAKMYRGSWMSVKLILLSTNTIDLYLAKARDNTPKYRQIEKRVEGKKIVWDSHGNVIPESQFSFVDLKDEKGIYKIPVVINNTINIDFILDLGASDISISPDLFLVLFKSGSIDDSDFIGFETYQFADGSTAKSRIINLKTVKLGGLEIHNVRASISKSINAPLLLGQSAMKKFKSYKIDVQKKQLILE